MRLLQHRLDIASASVTSLSGAPSRRPAAERGGAVIISLELMSYATFHGNGAIGGRDARTLARTGTWRKSAARLMAPLAFGAAALLAGPHAAWAEGKIKATHGDWNLVCDTPPGARAEQCAMVQSVIAEDQQNVGLTVIVLKTADGKSRIIRVLAPLGVLLPSGLGLKIDETDVGRAGFVRCLANGCIAEVIMQDDLIAKLKAGTTATFIVFKTPEEGVGIPVALKGFAEGLEQLR
jgi:invasion protein IalB